MNKISESRLEIITLDTPREADIATEFGDGSQFKVGDEIIHDFKAGRYYRRYAPGTVGHYWPQGMPVDVARDLRVLLVKRGELSK